MRRRASRPGRCRSGSVVLGYAAAAAADEAEEEEDAMDGEWSDRLWIFFY
jgi:Mn-dependent DtxR family transcriptional regulator